MNNSFIHSSVAYVVHIRNFIGHIYLDKIGEAHIGYTYLEILGEAHIANKASNVVIPSSERSLSFTKGWFGGTYKKWKKKITDHDQQFTTWHIYDFYTKNYRYNISVKTLEAASYLSKAASEFELGKKSRFAKNMNKWRRNFFILDRLKKGS